ncbi:MAG: hypothetical protein KJ697_01790 [Nanoarchaeota archaeon]|nr:hypothetical protein [Nanoarchaeota archaeon]
MSNVLIYVDTREVSANVIDHFAQYDCEIQKKMLPYGDFLVSDRVCIERKSVVSDTPVIVLINDKIAVIPIEQAYYLFKNNFKIKVMGTDFKNKKIDWFDVYDVTSHKSSDLYGISFTTIRKRKFKNEIDFQIKVTGGHNVYVLKNKRIECIPTKQLRVGDYLLIVPPKLLEENPKIYNNFNEYLTNAQSNSTKGFDLQSTEFRLHSSKAVYKIPDFNENLFFVLGLTVADGHFYDNTVCISQKNDERNKIIEYYLKEVFGNYCKDKDAYKINSKIYSRIFSDIFAGKRLADSKIIPPFVLTAPNKLKAAFIRGYLFGDGYVNKNDRHNPQLKVCSKSKSLIAGLSYLLYSLHIENDVLFIYKTYMEKRRKYYELSIQTKSLQNFLNYVGQIPTKEFKINRTYKSRMIPIDASHLFYKPLLKLNHEELCELYKTTNYIKYLYNMKPFYIAEFKEIVKKYNKKEFAKKYHIHYSTVRNLTNNYAKSTQIFLDLINIIRSEHGLEEIKIDFITLRKMLRKLNINTYFINTIYRNEKLFKTESFITNLYEKINRKIGFDSLFLLTKLYSNEIYLKRIRKIEKIHGNHVVYDFSVKNSENFVGGMVPVLLHNTASDFLSSIVDKRLFQQMKDLRENFEKPILIIEGNDLYDRLHPNAVRGALASIALDFKIPIIWTKNVAETVGMIFCIARREQIDERKTVSFIEKKKATSLKDQQELLVHGLPGVSIVRARSLLKHLKTPGKIFNASEKTLAKVENIGKTTAKKIRKVLVSKYE